MMMMMMMKQRKRRTRSIESSKCDLKLMMVIVFVCLSLASLLGLHPSVLKPYLDLSFREIEIPCQFPSLLLGNIGIEEEFLFQFKSLKL